jgi:hypothetical protein
MILMGTSCHSHSVDPAQWAACEITGPCKVRDTVGAVDAQTDLPEVRRAAPGFGERVPEHLKRNLEKTRNGQ